MKRIFTVLMILTGVAAGAAYAQPTPQQISDMERQKTIDARHRGWIDRTAKRRQQVLVNNDSLRISQGERRVLLGRGRYKTLPRKLTKENLKYLEPTLADYKKYEEFLAQPGTGLIKLLPDIGCRKQMVIDAASPCLLNATIPGDGASYSFRANTYVEVEMSDLSFKNGKFQVEGNLIQGVLFQLGDVPIETISLASRGMRFLTDFIPARNSKSTLAQRAELEKGVKHDGFIYGTEQTAAENTTYGLRSVAYRNSGWRDNRRDVIVVFRTVRLESDGSVIVVWKQLQNIESPKMKKENPYRRF